MRLAERLSSRVEQLTRRGTAALRARTAPTEDGSAPELPALGMPPWVPLEDRPPAQCNICRWVGTAFDGAHHSESAVCPGCGSISRDRFLHWSLTAKVPVHRAMRVIETSPRLGRAYRDAMATWFFYRTSDFDGRAHQGNLQLDLQAIELPDASLDVLMTAHVLEHVPDTDAALAEMFRVLAPGGHVVLQVPVLQGATAPPAEPEFHGDDTPVFWRFGFDLTERIRSHGFDTTLLCTRAWHELATGQVPPSDSVSPEFDLPSMLEGVIPADLEVVADDEEAARLGFVPSYMFLTWVARRPGG